MGLPTTNFSWPDFEINQVDPVKGKKVWRWDWSGNLNNRKENREFADEIVGTFLKEAEKGLWGGVGKDERGWYDSASFLSCLYPCLAYQVTCR